MNKQLFVMSLVGALSVSSLCFGVNTYNNRDEGERIDPPNMNKFLKIKPLEIFNTYTLNSFSPKVPSDTGGESLDADGNKPEGITWKLWNQIQDQNQDE